MTHHRLTLDFRNTNTLWCSVFVETLVRCGVEQAIISPGSRSTPLTMALALHPAIEAIPVLDERSAAFFALGLAKQRHRPVLLVCTSGTAGANYFPAIIEAQEGGMPLLIVTADRPPEMRDCASGQTIDQQKLFGSHVNWFHELAVPEPSLARLRYLRQTLVHACERSQWPVGGPVHLNAPFRDPLPPVTDDTARALEGRIDERFFGHVSPMPAKACGRLVWSPPATGRGLIIAGAADPKDLTHYVNAVRGLVAGLGWPVLADVLSPLRQHATSDTMVTTYDAILRNPTMARALTPNAVLCLGGWPTSKILREWLERCGAEIVLIAATTANRDGLHGRTRHLAAEIEELAIEDAPTPDVAYAQSWRAAERVARASLDSALAGDELRMFEGKAGWLLVRHVPAATPIFVANSMPVRDAEYFWPATDRGLRLVYSRGANGIDGTLSTALGLAHGGRPTVLVTGDLALLHDTNGFLSVSALRGSLTIVLIDNRGGGIFEHLPVAAFDPPFEKFWATPQTVDFGRLCAAYSGVEYVLVRDWVHFENLIATLPVSGVRVLHVSTDRKRDVALRKKLLGDAGAAAATL